MASFELTISKMGIKKIDIPKIDLPKIEIGFSESLKNDIHEILKFWTEGQEMIREKEHTLVETISQRGWFYNESILPGFWLGTLQLELKGKKEQVDKAFLGYFEDTYQIELNYFAKRNSNVAAMTQQLQKCIELELYFAAVPLIFIMTEVIANEKASTLKGVTKNFIVFNSPRRGREKVGTYLKEDFLTDIESVDFIKIYSILLKDNVFSGPRESASIADINRHNVLHGLSLNYGTRENAFKCLSFLFCIENMFRRLIRKQLKEKP